MTLAPMLFWAVLSDGYGGDACCDGYSLEFLNGDGCRNLLRRLVGLQRLMEPLPLLFERFGPAVAMLTLVGRGENSRLLILFEMVQCMLSANSSQEHESLCEDCEPQLPCTMVEVPGTDVFDIFTEEPRMCLALDTEVRQARETPEPAKSVQILFRGEHGLGVWKLAAEQSLEDWYCRLEIWVVTLPPLEGRSLTRGLGLVLWGSGTWLRWFFHRGLLGGSFGGVVKGGCLQGTGEWTCSNCGKTDCWSTRYSCFRCGVPRYFDGSGVGQGFLGLVRAKVVACQVFRVRGRGWVVCDWLVLLAEIRHMCQRRIPRTGRALEGEELVGRGQCLVRELGVGETG